MLRPKNHGSTIDDHDELARAHPSQLSVFQIESAFLRSFAELGAVQNHMLHEQGGILCAGSWILHGLASIQASSDSC